MYKLSEIIFALLGALLLAGCTGGSDNRATAIPRPTAWPRIQLYDSVFTAVENAPVNLEANNAATLTVKNDKNYGLDIGYPAYNATVYVTVISNINDSHTLAQVLDGRRERISRNLGTTHATAMQQTNNHGFECIIVEAGAATQTPAQLLAWNREKGVVVTATAFLSSPVTAQNLDSIAPVNHALARDLHHLAANLDVNP